MPRGKAISTDSVASGVRRTRRDNKSSVVEPAEPVDPEPPPTQLDPHFIATPTRPPPAAELPADFAVRSVTVSTTRSSSKGGTTVSARRVDTSSIAPSPPPAAKPAAQTTPAPETPFAVWLLWAVVVVAIAGFAYYLYSRPVITGGQAYADLKQKIDDVNSKVDATDRTVAAAGRTVKTVEANVKTVERSVAAVGDRVTGVDKKVGEFGGTVTGLDSRLQKTETSVGKAQRTLDEYAGEKGKHADLVAALDGYKKANADAEEKQEKARKQIEGDLKKLRELVGENPAAGIQATITKLEQALESVKKATITQEKSKEMIEEAVMKFVANVTKDKMDEIARDAAREMLEQFGADRTGMADWAQKGKILDHSATYRESFFDKSYLDGVVRYFLLAVNGVDPLAHMVISPDTTLGTCWPMEGSKGWVDIQLADAITVTQFSLEHVPYNVSHRKDSAPKDYSVIVLGEDGKPAVDAKGNEVSFGSFVYNYNATSRAVQAVTAVKPLKASAVRLRIDSNYGGKYTCIYRFRVHNSPKS